MFHEFLHGFTLLLLHGICYLLPWPIVVILPVAFHTQRGVCANCCPAKILQLLLRPFNISTEVAVENQRLYTEGQGEGGHDRAPDACLALSKHRPEVF